MRLSGWAWVVWAIAGLLLEAVAILTDAAGDTLTENIVRTFPAWLVYAALGWLVIHFLPRVARKD